jgi:hypothetical protein
VTASPYGDWLAWLEEFAAGGYPPLTGLVPLDDPELGGYAVNRLVERFVDAVVARFGLWQAELERQLGGALRLGGGHPAAALLDARRRLRALRQVASDPLIPQDLRAEAGKALEEMVASAQRDLERSLERRRGAETLLALVRGTPLTGRDI